MSNTRWTRRQAQRVRKRKPHARCAICGGHASKRVVATDWYFTGHIVVKKCYDCGDIRFAGPREAIRRQRSVMDF